MTFPKRFDFSREQEIYKNSVKKGYFKPEINAHKSWGETFVVPIPPPNVTGQLHIGHGLMATIEDVVCRYQRMKGKEVLWIPGTDHAGISTQVQVEKKLKQESGQTRHDLGRVPFLNEVWDFASHYRQTILDQFKLLGCSVDWDREQFTLSERLSRAVRKSFKNLHNQGKIYLGYRITNWCNRCQTVLSDAEVEMTPSKSNLYQIRYFLIGGKNNHLDVYTTRPETIPADVALAVHPADKRYKGIVGKEVMVPFVNRKIPIIADESVDMAFGSGVLKITPTHDQTDFEIGSRHNLPNDIFAIDKQGKWSGMVPEFGGMEVEKFFDNYILRLQEIGNLMSIQEHENNTPHCERCATRVEPLASEQRFVDVKDYAERTLEVIDNQTIRVYPERFQVMFHNRLDNVKPRCISRQLWWWHRVPVWQNEQGEAVCIDEDYIIERSQEQKHTGKNILSLIIFNLIADNRLNEQFELHDLLEALLKQCLVKHDWLTYELYLSIYEVKFAGNSTFEKEVEELRKCMTILKANNVDEYAVDELLEMLKSSYGITTQKNCFCFNREGVTGYASLKQNTDVLDTRFSSGLRPFSTLGWPEKTTDLDKYFPATLLNTANDILFPWVCRMIMMSFANLGAIPFSHVYFHGLIRDEKGAKMSKSKGNVIDPLDLINKYGTDALRLSLIANNPAGNDMNYSETRADYYSRFVTKLWNASRYVWMNTIGETEWGEQPARLDLEVLRQYIKDNQDKLNDFDRRILNGVDELIINTDRQFDAYTFPQSADEIVKFIWNNFCDRYIEIAKIQKNDFTDKILLYVIGTMLKLLHPFAPFVTEELRSVMWYGEGLCIASFPMPMEVGTMNTQTKLFIELISEFRNLKHECGIKPNEKITALIKANTNIANMIKQYEAMFRKIVMCEELIVIPVTHELPMDYTTKIVFDITIGIKTIQAIDIKVQVAKLEEQFAMESKFVVDLQSLLVSEWFLKSAPEPVRQAKQDKLEEVKAKLKQIELELQRLKYMG